MLLTITISSFGGGSVVHGIARHLEPKESLSHPSLVGREWIGTSSADPGEDADSYTVFSSFKSNNSY